MDLTAVAISGIGPLGTPELIILLVLFLILAGTVVGVVVLVNVLTKRTDRDSQQHASVPPPLPAQPAKDRDSDSAR